MSNILLETIPDPQRSTLEEKHHWIFMENDQKWHSVIGLFVFRNFFSFYVSNNISSLLMKTLNWSLELSGRSSGA